MEKLPKRVSGSGRSDSLGLVFAAFPLSAWCARKDRPLERIKLTMKLNMFGVSVVAAVGTFSMLATACGKEERKSADQPVELKPETQTDEENASPQTPEEAGAVVVDETGIASAVEKAVSTVGAGKCKSEPCFSLGKWSLDFGQTYVHKTVDGQVKITQLDGFNNSKLSLLQSVCLKETARALKEYAEANPKAMDEFAEAGLSTVFAARVYDSTESRNKVSPSLYFIKGTDGVEGGNSLARGKWVIRAAITGEKASDKSVDDCQILTSEQITAQLQKMKDIHIK